MKNPLVILTFSILSFCFVCGVCQSADVVKKEKAAKPAMEGLADAVKQMSRGGLYGDWQVTSEHDGKKMESILSFSRDEGGNQTGCWISWGLSDLKDVKYEDGKLSFIQVSENRDGESVTSKFEGTVKGGELSGTISSKDDEYKLEGKRSKRISRAVGSWEMKLKRGDKEFVSTLVIKADNDNKLTGQWLGQDGKQGQQETKITDVKYEQRKLTFKKESMHDDRQLISVFEGAIDGDTLSGAFKSESEETTVEGKRIGGVVIGTWNLEVTSDRGVRKQRLKVNADMSGLYGAVVIDKVNLEGSKVSFKINQEFGEQKIEMSFEGTLDGLKLTGELTNSRGVQKVTGAKVVRIERGGGTR